MNVVYQLKVGGVLASRNYFENVWHYQIDEASPANQGAIAQSLISSWVVAVQGAYLACLSTDSLVNLIACKRINHGGGYTITNGISQNGTNADGASFSAAVAADLAWYPPGPSNRPGHTFFCGIPSASIVGDVIDIVYSGSLIAFATAAQAPLALGGGFGSALLGTYSRKTDIFTRTLSWLVQPKLAGFTKRTLPVT